MAEAEVERAARLGEPTTNLSWPLAKLTEPGYLERDVRTAEAPSELQLSVLEHCTVYGCA